MPEYQLILVLRSVSQAVVWKMIFNISEKQASLCRVGPVILRLCLYVLVAQAFRGTKCLSFLVSLTFRCSVRYHLLRSYMN